MSTVWALGDYHRFATTLIWHFGPELVADTRIERGMRVLDVATGTGNVALRAAERGARVTAVDITPEQLERGRREADGRGLTVEWVEADAQDLPFEDGAFDVVTSAAGAIFAPDHRATAAELQRVTRPGGTIGMINFTPEGLAADFFAVFAPYMPAGPSPTDWGSEPYVRRLFAGCELDLERRSYVENPPGGFAGFYKATFGPAVAIADPAFERDLETFAERAGELRFEYLRLLAHRPAA
jgi:2-polyprenyl-6-hydroxyphenyl methylase/3-demethylubiquinone-9 3-methyltransferase